MSLPTYSTGTVSVSADGTIVTGIGTIWSGVNAKAGDSISIDGLEPVLIRDITDVTHLTLWAPWAGGAKTSVDYILIQNYPARVVGVAAAEDVGDMLAALQSVGPIFNVPADQAEPDPSFGADGQYAEQPITGKRWRKTGGLWVYLGIATAIFTRYDVVSFDTDRPASGELLLKVYPPGVVFRADMTDSAAGAEVAASADAVFSLTKNGTEFATLTFAAASADGVLACAADTMFSTGDVLRVIAPNPRDVTLSGVAATFIGYR